MAGLLHADCLIEVHVAGLQTRKYSEKRSLGGASFARGPPKRELAAIELAHGGSRGDEADGSRGRRPCGAQQ